MMRNEQISPDLSEKQYLQEQQDEIELRLREYSKSLDEKEAYLKKRSKPLPEKLYHVTTRQNADQILREGIDPAQLMFDGAQVVSLSDDIEFAKGVVAETQQAKPSSLVVLEIDTQWLTPSRIHNYLKYEDPDNDSPLDRLAVHEVHYESNIPPAAIKILKP